MLMVLVTRGMVKKSSPRLRERALVARGSQDTIYHTAQGPPFFPPMYKKTRLDFHALSMQNYTFKKLRDTICGVK